MLNGYGTLSGHGTRQNTTTTFTTSQLLDSLDFIVPLAFVFLRAYHPKVVFHSLF